MNNIIKRKWNQNSMVIIEDLQGMAFQAESGGHTFQISGIDGEGNTVALSGTPAGVMLRSDGQDVTLTCSVSGGVVFATLPANAYVVPGRFGLTIFLTSDGQKTAIYAAVGTVGKTSSGTVAPPAGSDVVTLVNQINAAIAAIPVSYNSSFAPAYSTSGLYSVGQYVTYNGNLYRCNTAITTAETWTAAHWTQTNLGADVYDLKSAFGFFSEGHATIYRTTYNDGYGNTRIPSQFLVGQVVTAQNNGNNPIFINGYDENGTRLFTSGSIAAGTSKSVTITDVPYVMRIYSDYYPINVDLSVTPENDIIQAFVQPIQNKEIGSVYDKVYLTQQKADGVIANYNLMEFPANNLIQGAWANANGKFMVRTDYVCSEKLMYACPGDVITIKQTKGSTSSMYFQFYGSDGSFVSASSVIYIGGGNGLVKTITVPANCWFFHFSNCHTYGEAMNPSDYDFDVYVNIKEKTTDEIVADGGTVTEVQLTASDFKQGLYNSDSRFVNTGELASTKRIGLAAPVLCRAGVSVKYSMTNNEQLSVKIFEFMPGKIQTALQESGSWITGTGSYLLNYDGYLIVNVRKQADAVIAPSDFSSTVKLPVFNYFGYINEMNERIDKVGGSGPYPYYGQKINLDAYNFKAEQIGNIGFSNYTPQSLCIYGDELFHMYTGGDYTCGYFGVYNLQTKTLSGVFEMDSDTPYIHCNSACFGNKQNASDAYPLMYVNSYMDNAVGKGVCFVEKIIKDGNTYTTEQVQKIRIDFADQEIWTGETMNPSTLAAGNWIVDTVGNRLIAYTTQGFDRTRFFIFELPALTETEVVLSQSDILDYFDVAYIANIQDACLHNGMIYLNAGTNWGDYDRILRLYVINLSGRSIVSEIHLEQIPLLNDEPEGIDYYDGSLIMSRVSKQLIKLDF